VSTPLCVKGIDLNIAKGDYLSVIGSSGSGKSTFLNMLGRSDVIDNGEYWLAQQPTHQLNKEQRASLRGKKIGFIFQPFQLINRLSAAENVALPLVLAEIAPAKRKQMVEQVLQQVGLTARAQHLPAQLSGGQLQRVAIAKGIVMQPELILADEPTGNLDQHSGREIIESHAVSDRQAVIEQIYQIVKQRHQNEEDITIITQQTVMQAFNNILVILTAIIGLLAGISLVVAGILIMNLSLISVQQRCPEIGLLKALGASHKLIQQIFVWESLMLVTVASLIGLLCAQLIIFAANQWLPILQFVTPIWSHAVALSVAILTALVFSWLPAKQAAIVSPVEVLRG